LAEAMAPIPFAVKVNPASEPLRKKNLLFIKNIFFNLSVKRITPLVCLVFF
jgi:hypothetical protein